MDIRSIDRELSVSGQIAAQDVPAIASAGFRAIVCNRPDSEGADQPGYAEIERAARENGLQVRYLPAESGKVTDEQGFDLLRIASQAKHRKLADIAEDVAETGDLELPSTPEIRRRGGILPATP